MPFVPFDEFDQDSKFPHKSSRVILDDLGYVLPQATSLLLGGIRLGENLIYAPESGLVNALVPVQSVNGTIGNVVLDASDVSADPAGTSAAAMDAHLAALDPHGQYSLESDVIDALALKLNTSDIGAPSGATLVGFQQPALVGAIVRTLQGKASDIISALDCPAVGDGMTDDTTAIQNLLNAAVGKLLMLGPSKTYAITSITIPAGVTLLANGSVFRKIAASASYGITIAGNLIADNIVLTTPGSAAGTDLGVTITGSNVSISSLTSTVDSPDYGAFAVRITGVSNVRIGHIKTLNWKSHIQVFNCDDTHIDDTDITGYITGLYLRDVTSSTFSGGHIKTMSPSGTGGPGENGILVESTISSGSTRNVYFSDFIIEDSPEHGVRFGGGLSITDIWLSRIKTKNTGAAGAGATGGTGIKVLGATVTANEKHKRFHITDCTVLDVSTSGNGQGNFCGFIIAVVEDVYLSGCHVGTDMKAESCWIGLDLMSAERVYVSDCTFDNCRQSFVRFSPGDLAYPGAIPYIKRVHFKGCTFKITQNSYAMYFQGGIGNYSEITFDSSIIYGGGPAAIVRADAPTDGSYNDVTIRATHYDPADTSGGPPLQCGSRFRYHWTGPFYGSFGANGLDGSVFVDTTTGNYKLRVGGSWINQTENSGVWSPTLTAVTNVDSVTANSSWRWMKIGSIVHFSGSLNVDNTTANALSEVGISLPVVSNFTTFADAGGTAVASTPSSLCGIVKADTVNDVLAMSWQAGSTTDSRQWYVTGSYLIK